MLEVPSYNVVSNDAIRVALTEAHGMVDELSQFPPNGVLYSFIEAEKTDSYKFIRSPIKGYLRNFNTSQHDLIEAVLSPILTENKWIYSIANLQEATAFNFLGCPLPRLIRIAYIKKLFLKDNLKKVIFWSNAGQSTLASYGQMDDECILKKVAVVYPAIRQIDDDFINFNDNNVQILFSGDFFRKGGVNVVDAFERAQKLYPNIKLILCCDEHIDFNTKNLVLRNTYLNKINGNPNIIFGRVTRKRLINEILPRTDIYALPTYVEAFGFALLEAIAFGIPVISTNYFAIPEIIEHEVCGFLIDTKKFNCEKTFRGYVVDQIPSDFREYMTEQVYKYLCILIESADKRKIMGLSGKKIARNKFSIEARNIKMLDIYREALF